MAQNTSKPVIDFTSHINDRTINFTGREWVFKAIDDWLADPARSRFFLLVGEPGSGKTAIACRLFQLSQGTVPPPDGLAHLTPGFISAFHFCSAHDSRWVNPHVFSESIATQLAEQYPAYREALVEKSGNRQIHIKTWQHTEGGPATGIVIHRLDVSGVIPEDTFNLLVREPLEAFIHDTHDQQIIILIDALDEALSYSGNTNIISLLAHIDNLPIGVRFILTSRKDERVETSFLEAKVYLLSADQFKQRNRDDIRRYVNGRLQDDKALAEKAVLLESAQIITTVERIICKSEENFLYVRFLLDAIAKGLRSLTELEGLPEGLAGLYFDSLRRLVDLGGHNWLSAYAPLMGVLSVAQESLTQFELQVFTGLPESDICEYLSDLQQFLEEESPSEKNGKRRYFLYHQSVIDFLGLQELVFGEKQLRNKYYLSAKEWHTRIVDHYRPGNLEWEQVNWGNVEDYGLLHLAVHLHALKDVEAYRQQLYELLCKSFMLEKFARYGSYQSFASDVVLAIDTACAEKPSNMMQVVRGCLIYATLGSLVTNVPLEMLSALVMVGQVTRAMDFAILILDPMKQT